MPLTTDWPLGARSTHRFAPYRSSDRTDATPKNAVFVAANPRLADAPHMNTGKQHNQFDYGMTKYFGQSLGAPVLSNETGTIQYENARFQREERGDWRFSLGKFERLLDDAVAGLKAAQGRTVDEKVFADGWDTIALLDSLKATELLVQTVREGELTTKIIDKSELDPALAKTFDKLDVYEG